MLTVSLQEVVDKYHDLETDHSDCLTRDKRAAQRREDVLSRLNGCNHNSAHLEKARNTLLAENSELKTELTSNEELVKDLTHDVDDLRWKLNLANKKTDEVMKSSDESQAKYNSTITLCQEQVLQCKLEVMKKTTTKPPVENRKRLGNSNYDM